MDTDTIHRDMASDPIDGRNIAIAAQSLLGRSPDAVITALTTQGLPVDLPASFDAAGHTVLTGPGALQLVVTEDRKAVVDSWSVMLETGSSRAEVHLSADAEHVVVVHHFDVRAMHGVCLSIMVPNHPLSEEMLRPVPPPQLAPRLGRMKLDELATILAVDEGAISMLGWAAEEMVGRGSLEFVHVDDHQIAIESWMTMLSSPGEAHGSRMRRRHRDGSWVWVQTINHNYLHESDPCVRTDLIDISAEVVALERLHARERLLDRLAEALPVGLFQIDGERRVIYCNDRLTQILGHDPRTVMAPVVNAVDDDRLALDAAIEAVLRDGTDADIEVRFHQTGTRLERIGAMTLRALTDEGGVVTGAIASLADITESASMRLELERRASYDPMTGCRNRGSILMELGAALAEPPTGGGVGVVFIDLDRFKTINDDLGHQAGDELLTAVAQRLQAESRGDDTVGRIGGDEFLVVCPHVRSVEQAMLIAARLTTAASGTFMVTDHLIEQRLSVGVAWSDAPVGADELIRAADEAMYESKRRGDGRPVLATGCGAVH